MANEEQESRAWFGILVVDDDENQRFLYGEALRPGGWRVFTAPDRAGCFRTLREEEIHLVFLDRRLQASGESGDDILKEIHQDFPEMDVVMVTAYADLGSALKAGKHGARGYVTKPVDIDILEAEARDSFERWNGRRRDRILFWQQNQRLGIPDSLVKSPAMKKLYEQIERVARAGTSTILIQGETGVGKEYIARRIHALSDRSKGPFIELNTSAVPENLLESEIFGFERGAFTDAKRRKEGLFELANGGTFFLDEIAEMSLTLQAKLLRVLEAKSFKRLGGTTEIIADARILAATNKELHRAVQEGKFREDLYFRLSVIPLQVPPLRERQEDIPGLVGYFVSHISSELKKPVPRTSPETEAMFVRYAWPGNVRELRNVIERALLLESSDEILPMHLPEEIRHPGDGAGKAVEMVGALPSSPTMTLAESERATIERVYRLCEYNKTRTAEKLGISRQTLRTKLKEYQLQTDNGE